MDINNNTLINLMPKYYRVVKEILELQYAIFLEMENIDELRASVFRQFFIKTATWSLPLWEQEFGLKVGDTTSNFEERREKLIAKLRSTGTTTKEKIVEVGNAFTNGGVEVIEDNPKYFFTVEFTSVIGLPKNLQDFEDAINRIKPAHLAWGFKFRYRTHAELRAYTHGQLRQFTHDQLYQGGILEIIKEDLKNE